MHLRPATREDREFLWSLHCSTMRGHIDATWGWDETWQCDHFNKHFLDEASKILKLNGKDIGRVEVHQDDDGIRIGNIQILPEYQNCGIGSRVVSGILDLGLEVAKPVTLQVLKVNPARRFYERLGFVVEGEDDAHFLMRRRWREK